MKKHIRERIVEVCSRKIDKKGIGVNISFYAFFANKNECPEELMEVAEWWIKQHQLDHFEKATKIRALVEAEL